MSVSINDESNWETLSVLLKTGQRLIKKTCNWLEVGFPAQRKSYFPGCNAARFLQVSFLAKVDDKKELLKLLLDFFGRTFHLSWKQKSCFVMFSLRLND